MYLFFKPLMLRTPLHSFKHFAVPNLPALIAHPQFRKALFLANPVFYKLLEAKGFDSLKLSEKEIQTLLKYYNRMCFRSTPLGLFASFSLTHWSDNTKIELSEDVLLHARLDHKIGIDLTRAIIPRQLLTEVYQVNPSLYHVYREYRFIKTTQPTEGDKLVFAIESLDKNVFTAQLLSFCGRKPHAGQELAQFIENKTGCELEEATDYLQFLVEAQVLLSLNDVNIVGSDYVERAISDNIQTPRAKMLFNISAKLRNNHVSLEDLMRVGDTVAQLSQDTAADANLFYSVSERRVLAGGVDTGLQEQLLGALQVLNKLNNQQPNTNLREFIKQFKAKYDQQKVPLLHAVDPEIGVGYSNVSRYVHNLVPEGVWKKQSNDAKQQIQWSAVHRLFMELWHLCVGAKRIIELTDDALEKITANDDLKLPPSMSIMFRRAGRLLQIESAGGASALSLIGRFSIFNSEVEALCQEIAQAEQQANPNVIFAEVAQLSNMHVDNINRRKHAYNYEIPINAVSTLSPDKQIALGDVWLSVMNDELILESESRKMRVIPRLSSAYNVVNNDLGVFRLLSDIQYQGLKVNLGFSLESLFPGLPYYPRVQYKDVVLCLAVWNLGCDFVNILKQAKTPDEGLAHFSELRAKWQFPRHIAISRGDQFLVFDLDKTDELLFLLACIKSVKILRIQEYLPDTDTTVSSAAGPLSGQYIALLHRADTVYKPVAVNQRSALYKLKRTHIMGGEWLYLKFYCDQSFADTLLVNKIYPLIKQLQRDKTVKDWFFIRYTDTGYHIRLRMRLTDGAKSGAVLRLFKDRLFDIVHNRLIKEYQADTYQPELERYGHDIMPEVEEFFYRSSTLIAAYIAATMQMRGLFDLYGFAMVTVNDVARQFIEDKEEKAAFYDRMASAFYREFADDKQLRVEMDITYRNFRKDIVQVFGDYGDYRHLKLKTAYARFKTSVKHLSTCLVLATPARRQQLLSDIIHMHVNRTFTTNQRQQELLVYYLLAKHAQSVNAIHKGNKGG